MRFREFLVPPAEEWIDSFGIESTPLDGNDDIREVRLIDDGSNLLQFVYDIQGRSIRLIWSQENLAIVSLLREGATFLRIDVNPTASYLAVNFETAELSGNLTIHLTPELKIIDSLLFS